MRMRLLYSLRIPAAAAVVSLVTVSDVPVPNSWQVCFPWRTCVREQGRLTFGARSQACLLDTCTVGTWRTARVQLSKSAAMMEEATEQEVPKDVAATEEPQPEAEGGEQLQQESEQKEPEEATAAPAPEPAPEPEPEEPSNPFTDAGEVATALTVSVR